VGESVPLKLRDKWIEMMGAGMVHPEVLKNAGLDPKKYQGFAFGMGLDRLALLRWSIDDVRLMHSGDLRFINQF
jgi:phenylalanyl-tRNA synthetase alpha chain